jgi:hypothetical protein
MVPMVLRAVPWRNVLGTACIAAVLGGCGVAFPAAGVILLASAFALLAASSAGVLDEPSSDVVDVTPTGIGTRTAIRALGLLVPALVGAVLIGAGMLAGMAQPWPAVTLTLAGNIGLGFAIACALRTRTGEPGPWASGAVIVLLFLPGLVPVVNRYVQTFPLAGAPGLPASTLWWWVLGACVTITAVSLSDRLTLR